VAAVLAQQCSYGPAPETCPIIHSRSVYRHFQRRITKRTLGVDIGSVRHQKFRDTRIAAKRRKVQRRIASIIAK
jgi:hypothetical protein